ncbi:hypothetical protein PSAC2689_150179 [Paraburkholderia sacchari]
MTGLQRFHERSFVHESAARRVDEERTARHARECVRIDQVVRRRREGAVQRNDVAAGEQRVERHAFFARIRAALLMRLCAARGEQHAQSQRAPHGGRRTAERARADDAERRAREIADRKIEETELTRFEPAPGAHGLAIGEQTAPQREDQRKCMLRHGVHGIVADVAHDDAARLARLQVHIVRPGGRNRDHAQPGCRCERFGGNRGFVGDDNLGVANALCDFGGGRAVERPQDVLERQGAEPGLRRERGAVEEDDLGWRGRTDHEQSLEKLSGSETRGAVRHRVRRGRIVRRPAPVRVAHCDTQLSDTENCRPHSRVARPAACVQAAQPFHLIKPD